MGAWLMRSRKALTSLRTGGRCWVHQTNLPSGRSAPSTLSRCRCACGRRIRQSFIWCTRGKDVGLCRSISMQMTSLWRQSTGRTQTSRTYYRLAPPAQTAFFGAPVRGTPRHQQILISQSQEGNERAILYVSSMCTIVRIKPYSFRWHMNHHL
jgi:hypothetical protein